MRRFVLAALATLTVTGAEAQFSTQPSTLPDPNSWNRSMIQQNEIRSLQQQSYSNQNALRLDNMRNVQLRPAEPYAPVILHRGRGFNAAGPSGRGVRRGRSGLDRSLDTGICVGC